MSRRAIVVGVVLVLGLSVGAALLGAGNLAELAIREIILDPPSLVMRGTQLNVVVHVANTGTRTAEHFETGLYIRPQQEGDPWMRLPGVIETPYMAPAEGRELELAFSIETMDWEPGTYEIRAVVDLGNAIQETDELNNELIVVVTIVASPAGLPDLQPIEINFTPTDPEDETAPWTVSILVVNVGDASSGPFRVTLLRNGLAFATIPQFGLPKSGQVLVSGTLCGNEAPAGDVSGALGCSGGLPSGIFEIRALVDSNEEVVERDERNNTLIGTLSIQALELRPKSLTFDRSPIRLNDDVTLTAAVVNTGRGSAESVQVAFFVNGRQLDVQSVGPISYLGEVKAETVLNAARLGFVDAPETYEVRIVVDPHDLLHETDEDNNELVRSMTILEPLAELPELMPRSLGLYPSSPVELGQANEITVTTTVLNSGRSAASDVDVRFFYRSKGALRWISFPCVDDAQCAGATLAAGASSPFVGSLSTLGLSPGVYEIRVAVDPHTGCGTATCNDVGKVAELDERNNELVTAVTLQAAQLPDLVACGQVSADPSYAVRRGRSVTLSLCVSNEGDVASGPFSVRFSHCPAPETAAGQTAAPLCDTPAGYSPLGLYPSIVLVPSLAAGEQVTVATRLETEELNPGAYYLNVELDVDPASPLGAIVESNESNNLAQGAIFVVGPDLAVVDLQMTPPSPVAQGQLAQVAAIVSNFGDEAAGQFEVSFYVMPTPTGAVPTVGCAGGADCAAMLVTRVLVPGLATDGFERIACNLDTTALAPGSYILRAEAKLVDVPGKVPEHAVLNNALEIPFTVAGGSTESPGGPVDLAVQQVHVLSNVVSAEGNSVAWVLVSNLGTVAVGPFDVSFAITDSEGKTMTLVTHAAGGLAPGTTDVRVETEFATTALSDGNATLTVILDPGNLLPETDRTNNVGTRTFRIR
jgi:subtilase family serine protease